MNIIRSQGFKYFVAFTIGAIIGLAYFASVVTANAQGVASQVSIAASGQVQVKGARIVKIDGNQITAVTEWGTSKMQWQVKVSGSTRFSPQAESRDAIAALKVGHMIGFSGSMDTGSGDLTVYAGVFRNESLVQSSMISGGSVISSSGTSILIQTPSGTSTILLTPGTIITLDGNAAKPDLILPGSQIKAFGSLNIELSEITADRVTAISPQAPQTDMQTKQGILQSIVAWFSMRGSSISVR